MEPSSSSAMKATPISFKEDEGYVSKELCDQVNQLIDQTEQSKDKILLIRSEHNAKGKEVQSEYNLLKEVGGLCKRSCTNYFQTNISFVESSEHFYILFKVFRESLNHVKKKLEEVEQMKNIMQEYKTGEEIMLKEKKERNEKIQKELEELNRSLSFMNTDTENIKLTIKELKEQMMEHTEAYESFLDISNANSGKKSIMCDFLLDLQNQYQQIEQEITEEKEQKKLYEEEFLLQKKEMEISKEELIKKEAELKFEKENKILRKKEVSGKHSISESQEQILENQIKSQEYFLNMMISSIEDGLKRKEELENKIETVNKDIQRFVQAIKETERIQEKEKICEQKLISKSNIMDKKYKEKEEELANIQKEEQIISIKIENEKNQSNDHVLCLLKEEQIHINEKIANYKMEIQNTIKQEQENIQVLEDIDLEIEPSNLIVQLELILLNLKKDVSEKQKEEWTKQREVKTVQKNISDIKIKIEEEKKKNMEMNESMKIQKKQIKEFQKKNEKIEKRLNTLREEKQKRTHENQKKQEELDRIEKEMVDISQNTDMEIIGLATRYDKKIQVLYDTKNSFEGFDSLEKNQMKEEVTEYFRKLEEEYEMRKKTFEKEIKIAQEEERNQLNKDLKNKNDLLEYYKVLINKYVVPTEEGQKKRSKNKKGEKPGSFHKKNKKERTSVKNINKMRHPSGMKWLLTNEPYKFTYFDLTSPDFIKNNSHNKKISPSKSPHINKILENIKQRTDSTKERSVNKSSKNYPLNSNGIKGSVISTTNNNSNENTTVQKIKPSTTHPSYDIFQHL